MPFIPVSAHMQVHIVQSLQYECISNSKCRLCSNWTLESHICTRLLASCARRPVRVPIIDSLFFSFRNRIANLILFELIHYLLSICRLPSSAVRRCPRYVPGVCPPIQAGPGFSIFLSLHFFFFYSAHQPSNHLLLDQIIVRLSLSFSLSLFSWSTNCRSWRQLLLFASRSLHH